MKIGNKFNIYLALRQTNSLSGTPSILKRQAKLFSEQGYQTSVISESFGGDLKDDPKIKCLKAFKWPKSSAFQRNFFDLQARRFIKKDPKAFVIGHGDILHQDVLFLHNCVHLAQEIFEDWNSKNVSLDFHRRIFEEGSFKLLICNSHLMKNDLQKRFKIIAPIEVIYPGHDPELKNKVKQEVVAEIRKDLRQIVLGVITSGDLVNRGAYTTIEALASLPQEIKDKTSILIVGKEKHPEKVYAYAEKLGVKDNVVWMPPRKDIENIFASLDILVHAAKIETFGMVVLEAMSLGLPIIATETVGCMEIFPEVQKEFVISKQDSAVLSSKIFSLIESDSKRRILGEANRAVSNDYSWEKYLNEFFKKIEATLKH